MDELDILARDFGFRRKSNPMRSDPGLGDQNRDGFLFNEHSWSSNSTNNNNNKQSSMNDFVYDSILNSDSKSSNNNNFKTSSLPVYDNPVSNEDIFDGLKNTSTASSVRLDDEVFASIASPSSRKSRNQNDDFGDLLGNLGRKGNNSKNKSSSAKSSSSLQGFDDLLAGFGSGGSASGNRPIPESTQGSIPIGSSKHTASSMMDDPFVVLESTSASRSSSSSLFTDPLEETNKLGKSSSARTEASSVSGGFDGLDPLNDFGIPVHKFSRGRDNRGKDGSPSKSGTPQSPTAREHIGESSLRNTESKTEKKVPADNFQEPPLFDLPNVSTDHRKSFGQTAFSPSYNETGFQVDMSPKSEEPGQKSDDFWLTLSEVPLFTQPTSAPPPSRPPPPIPRLTSKSVTNSFSSNSRKKGDEFSSLPSYSQYSQHPKPAQPATMIPSVSQLDELEDFSMGRSQNRVDESMDFQSSEDINEISAAAMKGAVDKAEAQFRHAKEVRERQYAKAAKNKESMQLEKDEQVDAQEREVTENQERLECERRQREKEEEEREQRRLEREKERAREIERQRARQAVERATREARERAAAEACERAAAETRLKAGRAAVEKANAEARQRAGRAAVLRVQAEARERAAAETRERVEKVAAEAREKAGVAGAEAEARHRAERAAAEAREIAAAEAQEKAAIAAAKMNRQKNDNDLESFFNMGSQASSAPRAKENSIDPEFDQQFQNKGGSEGVMRTSSSGEAAYNMRKTSSTNIVDDLSSIFEAAPSSGAFQDVEGESEERIRARLERHQRTQERAAKAVAVKNQRDLQVLWEQEERHRIAETLDIEIKRWAAGKEGNLRALLSTLQYVLWAECGWQPVSLTNLITGASVKKIYRKATLCIHPDKVQQKGATLQQKYIAEKVFDLLKEAWNKFNSEELF
ncbi:Auxilin-related protein 2 [Forsythia ovata]|uniref:Auxilin-related protein 2 n=1 Tax=Forsythia ovata TaxID=205694 RepID=A0ABD1T5X6_9LAMI